MPLILLAKLRHLLKMGIKIARIAPSMKRAPGVSRCSLINVLTYKLEVTYPNSFISFCRFARNLPA